MVFDEAGYLKENRGVAKAVKRGGFKDARQHYDRYGIFEGRDANPGASTAKTLDKITSKDSPLMQRAATQGKQFANSRGLLNSSMAAEASQGAMIDRAMPIAQQDAGYRQDLGRMGQQDEFQRGQMRLGSNLSRQEATQQNQFQRGRMHLGSQLSRQETQQKHKQDLERLSSTSAANAWGVMANNTTDIVAQGMEGIANIQANPDITQADKTKMINQITRMRDTDIRFQRDLYKNMSGFLKNSGMFPSL